MGLWSRGRTALVLACLLAGQSAALEVARHNGLTITYRDLGDKKFLPQVFQIWDKTASDLKKLGLTVPQVQLEAALNAADFGSRTGEPVSVSAVTLGQTIQTQRLGALAARHLLPLTIRHEAFHAAQPANLPRWLAEGLARIFSGEASNDPPGLTGLARLSSAQLDAQLKNRDPKVAKLAYQEASRRAARELRDKGWAGIWQR